MKIKICGITTLDDALAALHAGADVLGFNFYPPGPRYITPENCAHIVASLATTPSGQQSPISNLQSQISNPITLVGVFVNTPVSEIAAILDHCDLDLAQLSGDETPEMVAVLEGRAFKAIRPQTVAQAEQSARRFAPLSCGQPSLLVDTPHHALYGGTGQTGDWSLAARLARNYPIMLAGGLNPENVAGAVAQAKPWGVDVASGVESSPGVKDRRKMNAFVHAARQC